MKQKGIKYNIWDPRDYGFDFYDVILFTSSKQLEKNPKMVSSFSKASIKGWEYAFENINETVDIILKKYNTQNKSKEALIFEAKTLKKLAYYDTKSLGNIDINKIQRIYDIYALLGYTNNKIDFNKFIYKENDFLTIKEKEYLNQKKQIKLCIDNNWMPFEAVDKNGNHTGISSDYFKLFSKMLNIDFDVIKTVSWSESLTFAKQRKCDILPLAMQTPERKKYMNFTTPYLKVPLAIATKTEMPFIDNLKILKNEKVAIPKGYAFVEILKKEHLNLNLIEVENIDEGLKKVRKNQVFGYIGTLPAIGYKFQTKFNGELKIAGKFEEQWELGIAVRNDDNILLTIMQKTINTLEQKQHQSILNNWISIKYEKGVDYSAIFKIILITAFIILLFIYWNRKLHNSKSLLEILNEENNKHLEIIERNVLISSSDTEGKITEVSEALCKITGYTKEELIGKPHNIFRHKDMPSSVFENMWNTITNNSCWHGEIKNLNKDGSYYWARVKINPKYNDLKEIIGYTAIRENISDKKRLEKISITDSLTKIYNRLYLDETYKNEVHRAKRYRKEFSIILIDIDFFKKINDNYGHNVGDIVLKEVANILKNNIRQVDKIGRWGGEEFLIICPETNAKNTKILAEHLRKKIENNKFTSVENITCSFGVTMFNLNKEKDITFINADEALYKAKKEGRNRVILYS